MSHDKAIEHGKTRRKPYRGAAATSGACRIHGGAKKGGCPYCEGNRTHKHRRREPVEERECK
jgi:hypothetical protein